MEDVSRFFSRNMEIFPEAHTDSGSGVPAGYLSCVGHALAREMA